MQGEAADVAEAIFEAALPRQAGDVLPTSSAGLLVAVADRLDSLVGLFAAGCAPTASADQYGLRRAAYGMLQVGHAGKEGRPCPLGSGCTAGTCLAGWVLPCCTHLLCLAQGL